MTGDSAASEGLCIIPRRAPCTAVLCVETLGTSFSSTGFPHSKRWRITKHSSAALVPHLLGVAGEPSLADGEAGCGWQRSAAYKGSLAGGDSSQQEHSGHRAGQRLSHPPGFPGPPRGMDGTGSPTPSGSTVEPGGDSPLAQQNLGAREGFLLHRLRPSLLHILDRFMEGTQHPQPAGAAHHTIAAKCPAE